MKYGPHAPPLRGSLPPEGAFFILGLPGDEKNHPGNPAGGVKAPPADGARGAMRKGCGQWMARAVVLFWGASLCRVKVSTPFSSLALLAAASMSCGSS